MAALPHRGRLTQPELNGLARALIISLALHTLAYGTHMAATRYHWFQNLHVPAWLQRAQQKLAPPLKPIQQVAQEPPLLFVEVNPAINVEPPKQAKHYSDKNSRAANPDADVDSATPKISGAQTVVARTEDSVASKPQPQPLQPSPTPQTEPEAKPKPAQTPGDLAFAKPQTKLRDSEGRDETERPKPRTIAEAVARQQAANSIAGAKMKQEGGVKAKRLETSLDAIATPFGAYDKAVIAAIQSRWYALIDNQPLTRATGKVTLNFHLNYDGRITELHVLETTVGELLTAFCQRAVQDPSPYEVWPSDMRREIGANFRDVTFTFYYY
jgi:outer membrane biosynthesis protein TonB